MLQQEPGSVTKHSRVTCTSERNPKYLVAIFHKEDIFAYFRFAFLYTNSLLERIYSIREEFAPSGSKFFPYRVDPF